MELGDRYSEYEKRSFAPSISSDNPQTRRPMLAFLKGTCRLVPNVEVLQCATWLEFLEYTGIRKYEKNRSLQKLGTYFDWCCFYYFLRNSLVALLEALFARIFLDLRYRCAECKYISRGVCRIHQDRQVCKDTSLPYKGMEWVPAGWIFLNGKLGTWQGLESFETYKKIAWICPWVVFFFVLGTWGITYSYTYMYIYICATILVCIFDTAH